MQGRRKPSAAPLTEEQILAWADAFHQRTGRWPHNRSGPIPEAPGDTWNAVNLALYLGRRGFPGGDSLAKLLDRHRRGATNRRPWTPEEDEAVRSLPLQEAARRTGRPPSTVYYRRRLLRRLGWG
jgi:hypothetical protein